MKRILYYIASLLLVGTLAFAQDAVLRAKVIPLNGKLITSDDPTQIGAGFRTLQNLRYTDTHIKGIGGMTKINTTANYINAARNGFHFSKYQPAESHVLLHASSGGSTYAIIQNTAVIPAQGNFAATELYTLTGTGNGYFSNVPNGSMLFTNGTELLVWSGNEMPTGAFVTSTAAITYAATNPNDYSAQVNNTQSTADQVAIVGGNIDSYTVLMLHGDGSDGSTTITDSETTAKTVTVSGNAQIDQAQVKFGTGSIVFDGTTDYLTTSDHADWNMADGAFTWDAWVRFAALPSDGEAMVIYSQRADISNKAELSLRNYAGEYTFNVHLISGGMAAYPISNIKWSAPAINTWYHVALVRGWGGDANTWAVTVNGTSLGSTSLTTTYPNVAAALQIGQGATGAVSSYAPYNNSDWVRATSTLAGGYFPYYTTDISKPLTGYNANQWISDSATNQRFHIDLGPATVLKYIYYENGHHIGGATDLGAKTFTLWGSNSAPSFADLTYGTDTGWAQLTTSQATFDQHVAADQSDPKYITVTGTTAYRYYAFKFADTWGHATNMGVRRIEFNRVNNTAFNGWMDEIRISKGIARWTANFTPSAKAYFTASNYWLVGSKRPLQGVKYYVSDPNGETGTLTVKEWNGASWTTLTSTDNTSVSGKTLAQTGTVTWTSTINTSLPRYINGLSLYWYQFEMSAGAATIYYTTVDAPMQPVRNIFDGTEVFAAKVLKYNATTYIDYTLAVSDESATTYADLSSLGTTHSLYVGFLEPQQGMDISFVTDKVNSTAATQMSAYFWNGSAWTAVGALNDATMTTTTSMSKGAVIAWQGAAQGTEFKRSINEESPLYYYKFQWADTLSASVQVSEIRGLPYPPTIQPYKHCSNFQNRAILLNDQNGKHNEFRYSAYNSPDIWNGDDSGVWYIGDDSDITAVANLSLVLTDAIEQLIITKLGSTYRIFGNGPEKWQQQQISGTVGCPAPKTMKTANLPLETGGTIGKVVAIWQGAEGIYITDGKTPSPIHNDIKDVFDKRNSDGINRTMIGESVAFLDEENLEYHWLFASGTSTTLNKEYVYDLRRWKWYEIVRGAGKQLQTGFTVHDVSGNSYTYGTLDTGYMERLENGNTFDGGDIVHTFQLGDMSLADNPLYETRASYVNLAMIAKSTTTALVNYTHYVDTKLAGVTSTMSPVSSGRRMANVVTNINSEPGVFHSPKFTMTTNNETIGFEPLYMGYFYKMEREHLR